MWINGGKLWITATQTNRTREIGQGLLIARPSKNNGPVEGG